MTEIESRPTVESGMFLNLPLASKPGRLTELALMNSKEKKYYVYLCGPIKGLTYQQIHQYYEHVAKMLPSWLIPLSPMRGYEELQDQGVLESAYTSTNPVLSPMGIVTRDFFDVSRADVILANFIGAQRVSIGSMFELAWAYQTRKPVVVAMEPGNVHTHPFVEQAAGGFLAPTLEQAIATLIQVVRPGL